MANIVRSALAIGAALTASTIGAAWAQDDAIAWRVVDRHRLFASEARADTAIVLAPVPSALDQMLDDLAAIPLTPRESSDLANGDDARTRAAALLTPLGDADREAEEEAAARTEVALTRFLAAVAQRGDENNGPIATRWRRADRAYDDATLHPSTVFIRATAPGGSSAPGALCVWRVSHDLSAPDTPVLQSAPLPCDAAILAPLRFTPTQAARGGLDYVARGALEVRLADEAATLLARQDIVARDRVFIGLGDSYASGEGNPDLPVDWSPLLAPDAEPRADGDNAERWWWRNHNVRQLEDGAHFAAWLDPHCHRSLRNHQVIASLLAAARDPHATLSFASFACSGARVLDGLLTPQRRLPGTYEEGEPDEVVSQMAALQDVLCGPGGAARDRAALTQTRDAFRAARAAGFLQPAQQRALDRIDFTAEGACASGAPPRRIETLMLAVGINESGFEGAILDTALPRAVLSLIGTVLLEAVRAVRGASPPHVAHQAVQNDVPALYRLAARALSSDGGLALDGVVHVAYPNPLRDEEGRYCTSFTRNELLGALHGPLPDFGVPRQRRWRFEISAEESRDLEEALLAPLNRAIVANADAEAGDARAWRVAAHAVRLTFAHGWCAGDAREQALFELPHLAGVLDNAAGDIIEAWTPAPPAGEAGWRAYADDAGAIRARARWFRAPNDAVLTQLSSNRRILPPFNLAFGPFGALFGAFHPSLIAHAAAARDVARIIEREESERR